MCTTPIAASNTLSIRYGERLALEGAVTSDGSRGDSSDNAVAESIKAFYKAELITIRGPWRSVDDVELASLGWTTVEQTAGSSPRSATSHQSNNEHHWMIAQHPEQAVNHDTTKDGAHQGLHATRGASPAATRSDVALW